MLGAEPDPDVGSGALVLMLRVEKVLMLRVKPGPEVRSTDVALEISPDCGS